jgi:hypothetical protein
MCAIAVDEVSSNLDVFGMFSPKENVAISIQFQENVDGPTPG